MMLFTHPADAEGTGALPWQESFTARLEASQGGMNATA